MLGGVGLFWEKDKNGGSSNSGSQDGGDLPKQFLTMLGGLVTTIVGFYFGSQTANSAAAKAAEAIKAAKSP